VAQGMEITTESIEAAAEIAGIELDADEREMMLRGLQNQAEQLEALHAIPLDNSIAPAILFDPVPPGMELPRDSAPLRRSQPAVRRGVPDDDTLAFLPVHELSELVRTRA